MVRSLMIQYVMSTLLCYKRSAFVGSARADHRASRRASKLHASNTDAPRGAVYQNGFACLSTPNLEQSAIRRSVRHSDRGALSKRNLGRQMMNARFRA